ncbi:MAG TPA: glycosyltransferase [Chitinophagaceae bacterium]|jgi:glycosyltransferase involved in cell wall biosynthesis|nr:glycosyltransferase [Chitinophagaceae bacterium]
MKDQQVRKAILVAIGLHVPGTGFTRVLLSLFEYLSSSFEIHWLGIGYKGEILEHPHYTLHPCNLHGGDIYGAYGAVELAEKVNAQTIFLLNDLFMLKNYEKAWIPLREKNIRLVVYAPLDGDVILPVPAILPSGSLSKDCSWPDDLALYNQWALGQIKPAMQFDSAASFDSAQGNSEMTPHSVHRKTPRLHAIGHGVGRQLFSPGNVAEQKELKQELFNVPDAANSIFILNANRYNERKDIETTITAFAAAFPLFQKPAYLCLHTPNTDPQLKQKLEAAVANSGCHGNILLNPLGEEYSNDDNLVKLYRACSIGINTSLGEGWGMISFEHAACRAAQIVPDHTAPAELWKGAAILIPRAGPVQLSTNPFMMYASDTNFLSRQLIQLVNDENYLTLVSNACYNRAAEDRFDWRVIGEEWRRLLMQG